MSGRAEPFVARRLPVARRSRAGGLPLVEWQRDTPPATLSKMLFDGHCVAIRGLESVAALVERGTAIVEGIFDHPDPERAESELSPAEFDETAFRARRAVLADAFLARHWDETLESLGYPGAACYSDRLRLRVVPSNGIESAPALRSLPPHRDNWGSGIAQQINWWMPLYPLSVDRTMVLWPALFDRPVDNDSRSWEPSAAGSGAGAAHALLPTALEDPSIPADPVLIEPGTLFAFSGAHLHASRNEARGRSRLSLDTRTVWAEDVRMGRGAPNVDGAVRRAHWEWFGNRNDPDGAKLAALSESRKGETL